MECSFNDNTFHDTVANGHHVVPISKPVVVGFLLADTSDQLRRVLPEFPFQGGPISCSVVHLPIVVHHGMINAIIHQIPERRMLGCTAFTNPNVPLPGNSRKQFDSSAEVGPCQERR